MKIFIDTNIIMDVLTKREGFYPEAAIIWSLIKNGYVDGYISAISVNNIYYIIKKLTGIKMAENYIDRILADFTIVSLTKDILYQARKKSGKDFEDLIQYFSALHAGCEKLITRNKKNFPRAGIDVMLPAEFLKSLEIEV